MGRVIVFGSLMVDLVVRVPRLPAPGESLLGESLETFLGGKGCNAAVAAARQGARAALIGCVGADTSADAFLNILDVEGVDRSQVVRTEEVGTGTSCVLLTPGGENAILALPRANLTLGPTEVVRSLNALLAAGEVAPVGQDVFLTQCETNMDAVAAAVMAAHRAGLLTLLNAAPIPREPLRDDLWAAVDVLIVNATEGATLAGMPVDSVDSVEAARMVAERLLARGAHTVILTLGARGSVWSRGSSATRAAAHTKIAAFPVQQVDATAAGDAFCGSLAAGLARGEPMAEALRRASAAGALAATKAGALPSLPTAAEVAALMVRAAPETNAE